MATKVLENIYVDNVIIASNNEVEAMSWYKDLKRMFADATMNIRQFTSNSEKLLNEIPEVDRAEGNEVSVLGVKWRLKDDIQF